ncbi:hypothetical protein NUSPORA_02806 [Nucleospora cyclopteri]
MFITKDISKISFLPNLMHIDFYFHLYYSLVILRFYSTYSFLTDYHKNLIKNIFINCINLCVYQISNMLNNLKNVDENKIQFFKKIVNKNNEILSLIVKNQSLDLQNVNYNKRKEFF